MDTLSSSSTTDPKLVQQEMLRSLQDPSKMGSILDMVKKMTPNLTEEQRTQFFDQAINSLQSGSVK